MPSRFIRPQGLALLVLTLALAFSAFQFGRAATFDFAVQEGDIVFQSLPHGDLVDAIEGVTRSPWSHCGIVMKREGAWYVAEAMGEVRYTPLKMWTKRGRTGQVEVYRLRHIPAELWPKLVSGVDRYIGRPYDYRYVPGSDEIYCSELVYLVFKEQLGVEVGTWEKLGDLNWRPHERFIRSMEEGGLPLERRMVTPVSITRSPLVTRVYPAATAK